MSTHHIIHNNIEQHLHVLIIKGPHAVWVQEVFWGAPAPSASAPGVSRKAPGSILSRPFLSWKFSVSRTVLASSCRLT